MQFSMNLLDLGSGMQFHSVSRRIVFGGMKLILRLGFIGF
jgi:hypothetical protein